MFEIYDLNAHIICGRLNDAGYSAYLIGGCVRDTLMNIKPHDYDIATDATPDEIINLFDKSIYKVLPTGIEFGTVTLHHNFDNLDYQVTTFRFGKSLLEDMRRRDFTINAIAYSELIGIVDPMNGQRDIENKIIRAVSNPIDRFKEDPLRVLRAIRFAFRFNFDIEESTLNAMLESDLSKVSNERIHNELVQILSYKVDNIELYRKVWPIINDLFKFYPGDNIEIFDAATSDLDYRCKIALYYFMSRYDLYQVEQKLRQLKFSNSEITSIIKILRAYIEFIDNDMHTDMKLFLKQCAYKYSKEITFFVADIINLNWDCDSEFVDEVMEEPCQLKDLAITGHDLIKLFPNIPNKALGDYLESALAYVWKYPDKNNEEDLIQLLYNINKE